MPSLRIVSGVLATGNSSAVALLTLTSVAWADSTTATNSSNGSTQSSSVEGLGVAFLEPAVDGGALLFVHAPVDQGMYFSSCRKSSLGISVPSPFSLQRL